MTSIRSLTCLIAALSGSFGAAPLAMGQPPPEGCTVDLIADGPDEGLDVGMVVATLNEDGTWRVCFTAVAPWEIQVTHVHAACTVDGFPLTPPGNPMVGKFDRQTHHDPLAVEVCVVIDDPGCCAIGEPTLFAAHAKVVDASDCGPAGCRTETAWADGTAFSGSNWAMWFACDVCPEACCHGNGTCMNLSPGGCVSAGGAPQGRGTDCETFAGCPEACCLPGGTCVDLSSTACVNAGGQNQGAATDCESASCTLPAQACCTFDQRICIDVPPDECEAGGGIPRGPASDCTVTDCPVAASSPLTQACCGIPEACENLTPADCAARGGTSAGEDTQCLLIVGRDTVLCPSIGLAEACCLEDGSCQDTTLEFCEATPGAFLHLTGTGDVCAAESTCPVSCAHDVCVEGEALDPTCIFPLTPSGPVGLGSCVERVCDVDPSCCNESPGWNERCIELAQERCSQDCSGCCSQGACENKRVIDCVVGGGELEPSGQLCSSSNCPRPPCAHDVCEPGEELNPFCDDPCAAQVCNLAPECCESAWDLFCVSLVESECDPRTCREACCFAGQGCGLGPAVECINAGGVPQGEGTTCSPDPCAQACCLTAGICVSVPPADCEAQGGNPQGSGTECTFGPSATCPPVVGP